MVGFSVLKLFNQIFAFVSLHSAGLLKRRKNDYSQSKKEDELKIDNSSLVNSSELNDKFEEDEIICSFRYTDILKRKQEIAEQIEKREYIGEKISSYAFENTTNQRKFNSNNL